jgi:hypothetical protein
MREAWGCPDSVLCVTGEKDLSGESGGMQNLSHPLMPPFQVGRAVMHRVIDTVLPCTLTKEHSPTAQGLNVPTVHP